MTGVRAAGWCSWPSASAATCCPGTSWHSSPRAWAPPSWARCRRGQVPVLMARSGENVTGDTLARFYALHVVILPLTAFALIGGAPVPGAEARDQRAGARGAAAWRRQTGAAACPSCRISCSATWSAGTWPWGSWPPWRPCSLGSWGRRRTRSAPPPGASSPSGTSSSCSRLSRISLRHNLGH